MHGELVLMMVYNGYTLLKLRRFVEVSADETRIQYSIPTVSAILL